MTYPGPEDWLAIKWVMKYLKGSQDTGLNFSNKCKLPEVIVGYVDSDFIVDSDKRRSQTGY